MYTLCLFLLLIPLMCLAKPLSRTCSDYVADCGDFQRQQACPDDNWLSWQGSCYAPLLVLSEFTAADALTKLCTTYPVNGGLVEPSPYLAILHDDALLSAVLTTYYDSSNPLTYIYIGATTTYADGQPRWTDGTPLQRTPAVPTWCDNKPPSPNRCMAIRVDDPDIPSFCYIAVDCSETDYYYYNAWVLCAIDLMQPTVPQCPPGWRPGYGDDCYSYNISHISWNDQFCTEMQQSADTFELATLETIRETVHVSHMMNRCFQHGAPDILLAGAFIGLTSQGYDATDYHWLDGTALPAHDAGSFLDFDDPFYQPTNNHCGSLVTRACTSSPFGICLHGNICSTGQCNGAIYERKSALSYKAPVDNTITAAITCK